MSRGTGTGRGLAVVLALPLVLSVIASGVVVAGAPAGSIPSDGDRRVGVDQQGHEAAANHTDVRHRDPARVSEPGDLAAVRGWLASRMRTVLVDCTGELSAASAAACDRLDREYPDWLDRYVDVVEATDADDGTAAVFEQSRRDLETYRDDVAAYRETRRAYRAAREDGNRTRARALARELDSLADRVNRSGAAVVSDFESLADRTGVDTAEGTGTVRTLTENVTREATAVREAAFVGTVLDARTTRPLASFLDPLRASGRLETENGTPVRDRQVSLAVGERTLAVTTDADGRFSFAYRPTLLPHDAREVPVRYVPRNESSYRGATATLPVEVRQVRPTVSVDARPAAVTFGEAVSARGRVAASGVGAPGVPVVVSIDGRVLGRTRTDDGGQFALTAPLPADVAAGRGTLRAAFPLDGRALAGATGTAPIEIRTTPTTLSLRGTWDGTASVRLAGRLATVSGSPVDDARIDVEVNGTSVASVETVANGSFAGTIQVPPRVIGRPASISVSFDADGTNLEAARAEMVVDTSDHLPGGTDGERPGPGGGAPRDPLGWLGALAGAAVAMDGSRLVGVLVGSTPGQQAAIAALAGVALLGLVLAGRSVARSMDLGGGPGDDGVRRDAESREGEDEAGSSADADRGSDRAGPGAADRRALDRAQERLAAGDPDGAVRFAYGVARRRLATRLDEEDPLTHWEFYVACRRGGLDEATLGAIERLSEAYERASFAPQSTSEEVAARALDDAAAVLEGLAP